MATAPPAAEQKKPASTAPPANKAMSSAGKTPDVAKAPAQDTKAPAGQGSAAAPTAAGQRFDRIAVRAKLAVSEPGDAVEREADQIADRVMRAPDPKAGVAATQPSAKAPQDSIARAPQAAAESSKPKTATPSAPTSAGASTTGTSEVKRAAAPTPANGHATKPVSAAGQTPTTADERVKRKATAPSATAQPAADRPGTTQELLGRLGPGIPLDADSRAYFQSRLGRDLSDVRIHVDEAAALAARELAARAFTFGNHIAFAQGEYRPDSDSGKRLLAHELAHVLQNDSFEVSNVIARKDDPRFKDPNDISEGAVDPAKHKTAKPALSTLTLPAIKSRHSAIYQGLAGQKKLKRPKGYDRATPQFATNQKENWKAIDFSSKYKEIDFDKGKSPVQLTFFGGNKKIPIEGTPSEVEERIKIPQWTENGEWRESALQVDHIVECQVGGPDKLGNYELLSGSHNINVGSQLRAIIYANVKNYLSQVDKNTGDTLVKSYLKTRDIDFETVVPGGEGKNLEAGSRFWSEKQIKAGEHLKWLKPNPEAVKTDGDAKSFALFSPTGNALLQVFPRDGTKVTIADKGKLTGLTMSSLALNAGFDTAAHDSQIGTLTATWNVPKSITLKEKGDVAIPILKIGVKKYGGALGGFPNALSADLKGASEVAFKGFSIVGNKVVAEGTLKPTLPLLDGLTIPVEWKGDDVIFSYTIPITQLEGKLPFKGLKIDDADLTLFFGDDKLGAEGSVQFTIANFGGGMLSARVEAKKGEPTFGLKGWIEVEKKLFDRARIELSYASDEGFGGKGVLEITQPGKIKGLKSARIEAGYTKGELFAKGTAEPAIPGLKSAQIAISYKDDVLSMAGDFGLDDKVKGVQSAEIHVEVKKVGDSWKVSANGEITPNIKGLPDTKLVASYDDGFFLVEGTLHFDKGPLSGDVKAGISNAEVDKDGKRAAKGTGDSLKVFGGAELTAQFSDKITGKVQLRLTPDARVLVGGGFALKPTELFGQFPKSEDARTTLLELSTPRIPVPGLAISFGNAAIGLTVSIKGGIYSEAYVGPGKLAGARIDVEEFDAGAATLNDIKIKGSGRFEVPAKAGLSAKVDATVNADAGVVGVSGGIGIKGEIGAGATIGAGVDFSWSNEKGLDIDGEVDVKIKPILTLSVNGVMRVEATLIVKTLTLWSREFPGPKIDIDPGISLAAKMKAGWNSKTNEPRIGKPAFETPKIDTDGLIGKVFGTSKKEQASTKDVETGKLAGKTLISSSLPPNASYLPPNVCLPPPNASFSSPQPSGPSGMPSQSGNSNTVPPVSRMVREDAPRHEASGDPQARQAHPDETPTMTENALVELGAGQSLDIATRGFFEQRMNADLAGVRIHIGPLADREARKLSARAFTVGHHIVFAEGEYDSHSESGKALLAHELAHVQQHNRGVTRQVMRNTSPPAAGAPAGGPPPSTAPGATKPKGEYRVATPLEIPQIKSRHGPSYLKYSAENQLRRPAGYDASTRKTAQVSKWNKAVKIDPRATLPNPPPPGKGWTLNLQQKGGASTLPIAAPNDAELIKLLKKPTWDLYGEPKDFQVDHMIEYQLGGRDEEDNFELLDQAHNGSVGPAFNHAVDRAIKAELAIPHPLPPISGVTLSKPPTLKDTKENYDIVFTKVVVRGTQSKKGQKEHDSRFWSLEAINALTHVTGLLDPSAKGNLAGKKDEIALQAPTGALVIGRFPVKGNDVTVPPGQRGAIAGYTITKIVLDKGPGALGDSTTKQGEHVGELQGTLNLGPDVAFPANTTGHAADIVRSKDVYAVQPGTPANAGSAANVLPEFRPFSPIDITDLTLGKGVFAKAAIHPKHPALAGLRIPAEIRNGKLGLFYTLDASTFAERLKVPGLKVDEASITLGYDGDAFSVAGGADFTIRNFGTGSLEAKIDSNKKFQLEGGFHADTRLFDRADMKIWYRSETGFGGEGTLAIDKPGKIRGIKNASVNASYNAGVFAATGTVQPNIPGVQNANLSVRYGPDERGADSILIEGDLLLAAGIPGIDEGKVHVSVLQRDDEWHVSAKGDITPHLPGLNPVIRVTYDDGLFTGEAHVEFVKSIFSGQATVGLTNRAVTPEGELSGTEPGDHLRLYGNGLLNARVTDWLQGTVGVKIKPSGKVLISGRIGVPAAVTVFEQFPPPDRATRELFHMPTLSVPLFGFAVGGNVVGIALTISGRVTGHAFVGPGQLTQAEINVIDFDPATPDSLHLTGRAQFRLPGEAGVDAEIDAGVSAGAAVIRVTAGVGVTAGAAVQANVTPTVDLDWKPATGLHLHADLAASLSPKLRFGVKGYAEVVADAFVTSFTLWRKDWNLAQREIGSSLALGLNVPVDYYSDGRGVVFDPNRVSFQVPALGLDTFKELIGGSSDVRA